MGDYDYYQKWHMEILPTEERREYTDRLREYIEYFQDRIEDLDKRTVKDRIREKLSIRKEKKKQQEQDFENKIKGYEELIKKITTRLQEEMIVKMKNGEWKPPEAPVICCMKAEAGAAMVPTSTLLGSLIGESILAGGRVLADIGGLSDKQQAVVYRKAFETAMSLLKESNISEEKIKAALTETMAKIGEIKEKYGDITDDDELAKRIQDECVIEVAEGIEKSSDYSKFRAHIEKTIGALAWSRMTQNAQIFLITGELLFDQWKAYGEDIDFAPICMSVSKALEVEVTRRYFEGYLNYLKNNKEPVPQELMIRDRGGYREKTGEEFMLGNITGVTGYAVYLDTDTVKLVGKLTDENQKFLKYARAELFTGKCEAECVKLVKKHVYNVKKVCVQYRNPSAHKQKVTKISARECLDYMIDVKRVMGEILDDCQW